ncbi:MULTISPECIES: Rha family transcriptional regulator [Acinetobacter]|uniref:Rha family transcriptional regulator n=1 Tax=Acinetobacter TaxID=469 RepID=UPI0015D156ED|nr:MULTISPECIES: phage antirepressor KilAC domain-containing protein [Acinetobacter]MCP0910817.1 phage antirepressor KilAC domain-containing protein [Acinetobacter pseudolwoffii]
MNMLAQTKFNLKTMSTREVSSMSGKQHSHVIRDAKQVIDQIIDDPNLDDPFFQTIQDGRGYISEIHMDRNLTLCLVSGYSVSLRMAIIRRWDELENQNAIQLPQTFAEALQLAADQARKIELDKPKVEYYEKIVVRDTLLNATQVAQKLRMSAMAMNKYLDQFDVYSRGVKRARVFQQWFIDKGFGELKQTELGFSQPMFTTKGEAWVIEKLTSEGVMQ